MTLSLDTLKNAIAGHAAAFRCITEYQPAGGVGDKVFPPTYEGGKYAVEKRVIEGGEVVDCVLLDSVQSQANRMELALLEAFRDGRIDLPVVTVRFDDARLKKPFTVTSLEAPHRVADAILRDSLLDGVIFRKSAKGKMLDTTDVKNATSLFGLNPTALVFGLWDSTGPRGGLGAKFQRALVSEMVGYEAKPGVTTGGKVDHMNILIDAGTLYERKDKTDAVPDWTLEKAQSNNGKILGKKGKPSEANLGGVTPDFSYAKDSNGNIIKEQDGSLRVKGGFTLAHAKQTTVLSLSTLRRLRFPLNGGPDFTPEADKAARTVLAALGLLGAVLAREEGADLRSRCQLFPTQAFTWALLDSPGEAEHKTFTLTGDEAVALFNAAVAEAKAAGLPWEGEILLKPSEDLVQLVAKSQELATHQAEGSE
ncbi:MAG: type I-G CRISPR-associated RAMP protein Csb1/Cas7g [Pseudomonadota bacterium]